MWMKYFLLDETNATSSDMSVTCDTSINMSKEKCVGAGKNYCDADRKCACDEQLIKFKSFYFLFFAGFGASFPYLGVYFKQIGLNASYVGILAGVRPLIQFISGPSWALLSDKYKARKYILLLSILAWLVMTLSLAFPRPHKVNCRVNVTGSHITKSHKKMSERSFIPYPNDFQGRFGFNLIYPHNIFLDNETITNIFSRRSYNYDYPYNLNDVIKAHRRFVYNSSEIVLSLEHDDKQKSSMLWNYDNFSKRTMVTTEKGETYVIERDQGEINNLFYIFLTLIVVGEFFEAPSFIMIDTALLDHLGDEKKHYGKTRLFGSVGYGVASFSVGAILDRFQYTFCGKTMTNYIAIFYIFSAAMIIAFLFGLFSIEFKYAETKEKSRPMDCVKVFFSIRYGSFLFICWFCGFSHGGIMNFLNWYLEDLGATKLMMGVATACRCSAIIFGFFTSSYFIDRIGHIALIFWALASYVGSFFGYSLLYNPWWAIPVEVIQGLIYAISWSSCITYLGDIAPPNTAATMQGILQGVYWGLGTGSGTIVGGFLINHLGVRTAFKIGGSIGSIVFVSFVALQYWIYRQETGENCGKRS